MSFMLFPALLDLILTKANLIPAIKMADDTDYAK